MNHFLDQPVRLYNLSCPPLPELLKRIRYQKAPGGAWRRALVVTLARMGQHRQESLARATAVEILIATGTQAGSTVHPKSATPRAMLDQLHAMERRHYGRGSLTPAQGHHPDVLTVQMRRATKELNPLTREAAEALWRRWGGGQLPEPAWKRVTSRKSAHACALELVAAASGVSVESLTKTLQRERRRLRGGQQTL
jgi:hypothetical protein